MNAILVLARFWGIILVVLCFSMLINAKLYVRLVKGLQDESVRFLYFYLVLVIGAVNVSFLNEWTLNLRGIVTLLGWGALLKGSFGILMPDLSNRIIQRVNLSPIVIYPVAVIMLIIGGYLLFYGFVY